MTTLALFIGERNDGKSTLIRGLSGCPTRSFEDFVVDKVRKRKVYVMAASPQEKSKSRQEYQRTIRNAVADPDCEAILVALQPGRRSTRPVRLSMRDCIDIARQVEPTIRICALVIDQPYGARANARARPAVRHWHEQLVRFEIGEITHLDNRRLLAENVIKCFGVIFI